MANLVYREVGDSLFIVIDYGVPIELSKSHKNYTEVFKLIDGNTYLTEHEVMQIQDLTSQKEAIKRFLGDGNGLVLENGAIYWHGDLLHGALIDRILLAIETNKEPTALINFLSKLQSNPSYRVREQLFKFLDAGGNVITQDGDFLAYKKVRDNYYDIHSSKYCNKPGTTVKMQRELVDDDPNRTCSAGLHVCSYKYLNQFGSAGKDSTDRVVVCKVNPADVVSVPVDYNDTKMRTCGYYVAGEIPRDKLDKDVLGTRQFFEYNNDSIDVDWSESFDEEYGYDDGDDWISSDYC